MAKRFKLRICRAITATWQSCRSKDPSILPEDPALSFSRLNADELDRRRGSHRRQSFKHHASSAFVSIGADEEFKWQKEEKWHVVAKMYEQPIHRRKICNSSASEDDLPFLPPAPPPSSAEENYCRGKRKNKKKKKKNKYSNVPSTSSAESGWFSSDGGAASAAAAAGEEHYREETGTLFSSAPSLSTTDTTSSNSHKIRNKRRVISSKRGGVSWPPQPPEEVEIPARLSMLKKLIPCAIDGKVKESFAVVKRSENPYEDFKNSMMDMITEKQMFDHRDLEQLLQCFLSLNSGNYHGIIVQVFSDIWNDIFSPAAGLMNYPQNRRRVSRIASF